MRSRNKCSTNLSETCSRTRHIHILYGCAECVCVREGKYHLFLATIWHCTVNYQFFRRCIEQIYTPIIFTMTNCPESTENTKWNNLFQLTVLIRINYGIPFYLFFFACLFLFFSLALCLIVCRRWQRQRWRPEFWPIKLHHTKKKTYRIYILNHFRHTSTPQQHTEFHSVCAFAHIIYFWQIYRQTAES